jgi:predicted secreted hydrolase
MIRAVFVFLFVLLAAGDWKIATPNYQWSFPRDHWAHDGYRTEWWYLTGQLAADGDEHPRFGYQFTVFRIGVLTERPDLDSSWSATHLLMGHAAITDLTDQKHIFSEVLYRGAPLLAEFGTFPRARIAWSRGPAGTSDPWTLDWNGSGFDIRASDDAQGFGFRLSTRPEKDLIFQGPNGFSRKGDETSAASHYYSFTRLQTDGELEIGGSKYHVQGQSWMDKEFSSSQLGTEQVGWDWFSLQLDDGRDLMLYLMRREDGAVDYASGTLVDAEGGVTYLDQDAFSVRVLDEWHSESTGATYPIAWEVRFGDGRWKVRAMLDDQENRSRVPGGVFYWEGMVSVHDAGEEIGRGYVEMTGYGEGSRPPV